MNEHEEPQTYDDTRRWNAFTSACVALNIALAGACFCLVIALLLVLASGSTSPHA
jgi:hypothetical protein